MGYIDYHILVYGTKEKDFRIIPTEAVMGDTESVRRMTSKAIGLAAAPCVLVPLIVPIITPWYNSLPNAGGAAGLQTLYASAAGMAGVTAAILLMRLSSRANAEKYYAKGVEMSLCQMERTAKELRSLMWASIFLIMLLPAVFLATYGKQDRNFIDIFVSPFFLGMVFQFVVIALNPARLFVIRMRLRRKIKGIRGT